MVVVMVMVVVVGVKGVGRKTAIKLLKALGPLEGIYDNLHKIGE